MKNEAQELNELFKNSGGVVGPMNKKSLRAKSYEEPSLVEPFLTGSLGRASYLPEDLSKLKGLTQWTTTDNKTFFPAGKTITKFTPGVYEIGIAPQIGICFERIEVKTENLIRFPQTNIDKVIYEIQNFWNKEEIFREYGLIYRRGILIWGPAGCHIKGTKVLMYDGTTKNVEDVKEGDILIGPNSEPKRVLELVSGKDEMYEIVPRKGKSFIVNGNHVLSLKRTTNKETNYPKILNCTVNDYLAFSNCAKRSFKLWHSPEIDFLVKNEELPLDPYFLGVWLGDGTEGKPEISTMDKEIVNLIYETAKFYNLKITKEKQKESNCLKYYLAGNGKIGNNPVVNALRNLGIFNEKYIPQQYLVSSIENRLKLLAGLIDTDGGYETASWRCLQKFKKKGYKGTFNISQKRDLLSQQIVFLARSLGFGVTIRKKWREIKKIGFREQYNFICIFGDISKIPVRLPRKKASKGKPNKDPLRTGIKEIKSQGNGDYYGFILSGNHLYLTDDFVVHHNSGKSSCLQLILKDLVDRKGSALKFTNPEMFIAGLRIFREVEPKTPLVVFMEDIDTIVEMYNESQILNILDGCENLDRIVFVATTNYPERLGPRIVNRPSRFDKRFKIDHPNPESRDLYLRHVIGEGKIDELGIDVEKWVKDSNEFSLAHLKELFVAVIIMGNDYDEVVETLKEMKDIKISSEFESGKMGFHHLHKGETCGSN